MQKITNEQLKNSKILVVDDVELNRKMLLHSLQSAGYKNIMIACNGSEALKLTHESQPDLIILDLMMPEMDGFAYCEEIRKDKRYDTVPIIVQTVLEQIENKIRAFKLGASDYICKPLDPGELLARVSVHLGNKLMTQALLEYHHTMEIEFEAARKMQERIMPGNHHIQMYERVFDMKIAQYFETSSRLGGDCWGMRALSDSRLAMWMYDFSGHGITAAMNVFRLHTVMQEFLHASGDPGNFLTSLNRHLYALLERSEFCTMFYGVIDTAANCLLYAAAGAQPAIIFPGKDEASVSLLEKSFPLGSVREATYETRYAALAPDNMLLFYSDGLVETKNSEGEFITEEKLKTIVQQALNAESKNPAAESVAKIVKLLKSHNQTISDDVTINAYWRCPASAAA